MILLVDILGSRNIKSLETYSHRKIKRVLHSLLKGIELKKSVSTWLELKKKAIAPKNGKLTFLLLFILISITFISRTYFLKYDSYTLSTVWSTDLMKVINFDKQDWFDGELVVAGDMAFVNFYSKVFNISPEIALLSMGMVEAILIVIISFWTIRFTTPSKYFAPLIAGLSYALLFTISPINLNYILEPRSVFLAFSFALPAMVYLLRPKLLLLRTKNFFIDFLLVFFTIGLIDLFVFCILLPPFLLISIFLTKNIRSKKFWGALLAYIIAAILVMGTYALISFSFDKDFWLFLHSNMVSVDSYTYIPQLIVPIKKLLSIYLLISLSGILVLLKLIIFNKENWKASLALLLYFTVLILLLLVKSSWLDPDLIILSLTIMLPLIIAINVSIIIRIFDIVVVRFEPQKVYAAAILSALFVVLSVYFQKDSFQNHTDKNETNEKVLNVYSQIMSNCYPYTYLVVNDYSTQVISENKHYFLNYSSFIDDYPRLDSIYFKNSHNLAFLKKHPEYVIPKSVFLFMYDGDDDNFFSDNIQYNPSLKKSLQVLKRRGRKIKLFCREKNFKVYEIINEPRQSRISDLLF